MAEIPAVVILAGLALYAILAGADFGAGVWQLTARGERSKPIREHAHHAIGPVWEANHVWLIFVLVVCWTAYPEAFGSIASTLAVPLLIAAVGIILRGIAYAMRSGVRTGTEERRVTDLLAISSILTPFALGTVVGAIASGRVPVGNAAGDEWTSWLNPTSALSGVLAVAFGAYMAAVYLCADARRRGEKELVAAFRARALGAGAIAGGLAIAGLLVVRADARELFDGLTSGAGLAAVAASVLAGIATMALVLRGRYEPARYSAGIAVAAIIAGWGIAQQPELLPGLTISDAAAGDATLEPLLISLAAGALVLIPSLALLFRLVLSGRFDHDPPIK